MRKTKPVEETNIINNEKMMQYIHAINTITDGGDFDASNPILVKPFFVFPKDQDDVSTRLEMRAYESEENYMPTTDITQGMLAHAALWADAMNVLAPSGPNWNETRISNDIRTLTGRSVRAAIHARLNYFINNALNILAREILYTVSVDEEVAERFKKSHYLMTNIADELITNFYDITTTVDDTFTVGSNKQPVYDNLLLLSNKSTDGTLDQNMLKESQKAAVASVAATNLTAVATNIVYNVLYRYLTIPFGPEKLQQLAESLTGPFIGFRNTIKDCYLQLFNDIKGFNIDINPANISLYVAGPCDKGDDYDE